MKDNFPWLCLEVFTICEISIAAGIAIGSGFVLLCGFALLGVLATAIYEWWRYDKEMYL